MAGEYYRWLARDVKPREKAGPDEATRKKLRRERITWTVVIALIAAVLAGDFIYDYVNREKNAPDLQIAYVGQSDMPEALGDRIEELFSSVCQDRSGNGRVEVVLNVYVVPKNDPTDEILTGQHIAMGQGDHLKLIGDLDSGRSTILLLEDPAWFREAYGLLAQEQAWTDCPVLNRELPGLGLTLALREIYGAEPTDAEVYAASLWQLLTAG